MLEQLATYGNIGSLVLACFAAVSIFKRVGRYEERLESLTRNFDQHTREDREAQQDIGGLRQWREDTDHRLERIEGKLDLLVRNGRH